MILKPIHAHGIEEFYYVSFNSLSLDREFRLLHDEETVVGRKGTMYSIIFV